MLTPAEARLFIYTKDEIIRRERQHDYDVMRKLAFHNSLPYHPKNSNITEEKFMPFPWDKKQLVKIDPADWTEERFREAERRYRITKA
jgi:hypothetical protein